MIVYGCKVIRLNAQIFNGLISQSKQMIIQYTGKIQVTDHVVFISNNFTKTKY